MEELTALRGLVEGHDDLFGAVAARLEALTAEAAQLPALQEALAARDAALAEANARLDQVRAHIDDLIARYRQALVADLPEPARPLVTGQTPEDLEQAAEAVRATVRALAGEAQVLAAARIPLGAPPRGVVDRSGLSPREKIALGLAAEQK